MWRRRPPAGASSNHEEQAATDGLHRPLPGLDDVRLSALARSRRITRCRSLLGTNWGRCSVMAVLTSRSKTADAIPRRGVGRKSPRLRRSQLTAY
jgi:hypothetical protein